MRLWLKTVYKSLMFGMPYLTYNPFNRVKLIAPFTVLPKSMYINYKLNPLQKHLVQEYMDTYETGMYLLPVSIEEHENPEYYLSVNIYNCTSPLFLNNDGMTRLEVNTYVTDGQQNGTLILNYISNALSMDPVNIFKGSGDIIYNNSHIIGNNLKTVIEMILKFDKNDPNIDISKELSKFTDNIFYKNGIYDKLYYDNSLINAKLKIPSVSELKFIFLGMSFLYPSSIFYFDDKIYFAGTMWANVFKQNN
jgi:hypothetical protein